MNENTNGMSIRQNNALAALTERGKFTGKVAFVGGRARGDEERIVIENLGQLLAEAGIEIITTVGRNTPADFLRGAGEVNPELLHVVAPWIQGTTDVEGNDVNFYRAQLGLKLLNLQTLEEIEDPTDKTEAKRAVDARNSAAAKAGEDRDIQKNLVKMHRRLMGALTDATRFEDYDEAVPYCVVGGTTSDGQPVGEAQTAFVVSLGYEPVDMEAIEPLAQQVQPSWDRMNQGAQKVLCSEAYCVSVADVLFFNPEPVMGGGSPNKAKRLAKHLGIPALNVRRDGTAESWAEFVTEYVAAQTATDEGEVAESNDLQTVIDGLSAELETPDETTGTPDGPVETGIDAIE